MDTLIAWIMRAIPFGTIIMYGAMGEIVTEKSGNLNLGVPGIMYLGGFAGFASAYLYENSAANPNMALCVVISLFCAFITSMLGGLIYSFLTISLRANQNVTGLALTTFGMALPTSSACIFSMAARRRRAWSIKPSRPNCPCFRIWASSVKPSSTTVSWCMPPSFWPSFCITCSTTQEPV